MYNVVVTIKHWLHANYNENEMLQKHRSLIFIYYIVPTVKQLYILIALDSVTTFKRDAGN